MSKKLFLKITKNINNSYKLLNKIFGNMLILGTGGLMLIVLYAFAVSKTLLRPIINITKRLSNMDERSLDKINIDTLPIEFGPLANSINNLTNKIENYLRYQKELFIGTAHELKTPLAVMKLKSEIILRKSRQIEEYKKSLELNISEINKIDKVISSVLDMGRQESAQFEKPIDIDIITFLRGKIEDYNLIAKTKMINIAFNTNKDHFLITLQPTLLTQIVQNFVQNAIKFTNNNKNIEVRANTNNSSIIIEVIDEGIGLHSDIDLFAPFVREGKSSGAGLGLFLAKSAANTLGASISISNRKDNIQGTISTLVLDINPTCKI
jgi:two-component system OmpR family sensor kinase